MVKKEKKSNIVNAEVRVDEFVLVPAGWLERLVEISDTAKEHDKQYFAGYVSSAKTILQYQRRVHRGDVV